MTNPKTETTDNTRKDPEDWVSGDEPMTGAQASYLKTLSEQAHQPDAYDAGLTKAEASRRIDALKEQVATKQQRNFTIDERGQTQPVNKEQAQKSGRPVHNRK